MENQPVFENMFDQVMQIWVLPEITKRQAAGTISKPYELKAAQVLLSIKGIPKVRLNSEVKAIMSAKLKVPKQKGEAIYTGDIEDMQFGNLLKEDEDFGHITLLKVVDEWKMFFSFIYGTSNARKTIAVGKEFLESASKDLKAKRLRPAINNLFIASEQIAKAALGLHPLDDVYPSSKKHSTLRNAINRYSHIADIIPKDYAQGHNKLVIYRDKARYDVDFKVTIKELTALVKEIQSFLVSLELLLTPHDK